MTDLRVLWLAKGLGRGGAEMLLVSLARAMDRTDLTIEVAYRLPRKTALVQPLRDAGITVHPLGDGPAPWPVELRRLLRQRRYDVVHSHAPLVGAAGRLLVRDGTVALHTEHNTWDRYHPATRVVNAATIGRNELVWAVSDQVAESIRPSRPLRRPRVEVLLHGVDLATVRRGADARRHARRRLGIDDARFVFGTVGNLAPKKDHDTMLRAFAKVHRQLPESCLVLIGTGPRLAELRSLATRLGIGDSVRFLGMRDDVPELLPAFDTFVLSSLHEGLSIALIEALGAGVPIVSTAVGGIPQLITNDVDGVLVPPRDVAALERAMVRLAGDAGDRARLADAGMERALDFSIQRAADTQVAHYRAVAGRRAEVGVG
ncbi:glycosyltransferase [Nocardioides euryhalodurans]|uniref:Glycosyltransferase n=1 Tax=Nocardioides euryhalodurans TaxID=2518370 RepID=A0A4P7GHH5_9ACTN|nr:glycosyltransferase [Nocardioides euryhalodurans]QBR91194.1 glycosyltransferase [Nocardioides euryhalodurans]